MALKINRKCRSNKAVTPAISTVIITGVMVTLITVALAFASNFLVLRMAESDFNSSKQFMQTLGLQIDDVAWVIGRTETVRYSSRYGNVAFESALNYTIYIKTLAQPDVWQNFYSNTTCIVCFNMPVERYSISNGYFELIYPSSSDGFLLSGASAPVSRIFAVEKLPMTDGGFVRVVVMPTMRMLNLTIGNTNYVRLYLPILLEGEAPRRSQSVTLTGESVSKIGETITGIKVAAGFPLENEGFNEFFFNLPVSEEIISFAEEAVLELFVGGVDVSFGVHA